MSDKQLTVIVFERRWHDWLSSLMSLASAVTISVANHRWGGGSTWVDALAVVLFFIVILSITTKRMGSSWRGSRLEAIAHLKSLAPEKE